MTNGSNWSTSGFAQGGLVSSGLESEAAPATFGDGDYKWRARAVDFLELMSGWIEFNPANSNPDFGVEASAMSPEVPSAPVQREAPTGSARSIGFADPDGFLILESTVSDKDRFD